VGTSIGPLTLDLVRCRPSPGKRLTGRFETLTVDDLVLSAFYVTVATSLLTVMVTEVDGVRIGDFPLHLAEDPRPMTVTSTGEWRVQLEAGLALLVSRTGIAE